MTLKVAEGRLLLKSCAAMCLYLVVCSPCGLLTEFLSKSQASEFSLLSVAYSSITPQKTSSKNKFCSKL